MWRWLNLLSLESAALAVQALSDLLISDTERRREQSCSELLDVAKVATHQQMPY